MFIKLSKTTLLLVFVVFISFVCQGQYFPDRHTWEVKHPDEVGVDGNKLKEAISFAMDNEYSGSKDLRVAILEGFAQEPFHYIAGPTKKRGGPAGVIIKDGYIVGQWGDVEQVDMTFSVTKSYLSTVAGLAVDKGLIRNANDKVYKYVWDGTFDGDHNQKISWEHLLTQSSDYSGTLFGMKDWADRPPKEGGVDDWKKRKFNEPGAVFEYNDVRVNVLAYSLLQVWRKPLPMVLKEHIMDPIGASQSWRWYGYDHSFVNVDGIKVQSVSGGGHSGGGLFINTLDHARFGLLFLNKGKWKDRQLVSEEWIEAVQKPSKANESYGYMWWLNRGSRKLNRIDDKNLYYAAGFGGNFIIIDKKHNVVIVTRWLEPSKLAEFMQKVEAIWENEK